MRGTHIAGAIPRDDEVWKHIKIIIIFLNYLIIFQKRNKKNRDNLNWHMHPSAQNRTPSALANEMDPYMCHPLFIVCGSNKVRKQVVNRIINVRARTQHTLIHCPSNDLLIEIQFEWQSRAIERERNRGKCATIRTWREEWRKWQ